LVATKLLVQPYQDRSQRAEDRVADLLSRMTVEEKAAQMMCVWNQKAETLCDANGDFDHAKATAAFAHGHGIGQVGRPSDAGGGKNARATAVLTNAIQKFFLENSRLGIPVVFHEECLHGHAAVDATSFSQPIGLAATFHPELAEALYTMTALEARARGTHQALTPVVDVARDPRWGRVEETFGEDPYLVTRMGIAAVRGFQGDTKFTDKTRVMATLKHFAAHGQPESGNNCAPVNVSMRVLRETFLAPFKDVIRKAGAISVMASYNEIDGVPSHANRWLLRDVLRGEWGFKGFVVSDYYAIWELGYRPDTHGHFVAHDRKESCLLAVKAGVNIELPEPDCYLSIAELVREGALREAELDELVAPMLLWKFRMGLFDDPYVDPDVAEQTVGADAHRGLALQAACETITLLKNDGGVAPLDANRIKTIAVIGPNAHRTMLGGYSGVPKHNVTVLDGIRAKVGTRANVLYSEGCKITLGGSWNADEVTPSDPQKTAGKSLKRWKSQSRPTSSSGHWRNEQTSREGGGLKHWVTARAWTWSAGSRSWSMRWSPLASL
jgi:beta-glucosidase